MLRLTSRVPAVSKIAARTSSGPDLPVAENYFLSGKFTLHAVLARLEEGHNIIMEKPSEVLTIISDFLHRNKLLE